MDFLAPWSFLHGAARGIDPLPPPFFEFEDLYFDPASATFFTVDNWRAERAIAREERGYRFAVRSSAPRAARVEGTALFLFEGRKTAHCSYHFFHLLEHLVGHWAFLGEREEVSMVVLASAGEKIRGIKGPMPWERLEENWEEPNGINRHLLSALFPKADVLTWEAFLSRFSSEVVCFARARTSDRALSYSYAECRKINRMLALARNKIPPSALESFRRKVHLYAGASFKPSETTRITYLKRAPPRALSPELEEKMLSTLRNLPRTLVRVEDFSQVPFVQQIQIIANTDLLLSVHGNGLSHILFLPENGRAIEIFPKDAHTVDYRLFADLRGAGYRGLIAGRGEISAKEAYERGEFGDLQATIEELDLGFLFRFLNS